MWPLGFAATELSDPPASLRVVSTVLDRPPAHPVTAGLADAAAGISAALAEPGWTLGERDLAATVGSALALIARTQALLLGLVGEVGARGVATETGAPSTVSWLRHRHKLAPVEAARLVRTAAALRAGLPATRAALGAGEISLAHAHGIARACADLPPGWTRRLPPPRRRGW